MASKISKEMTVMKRGMGEKITTITAAVFGFLLSVGFGFYWGWILAGIICLTLPVLGTIGGVLGMVFNTGAVEEMKAYSQSAGFAEQAL